MNQDIRELLPFFLNGTLCREEHSLVEDALARDPELREELKLLQSIQNEIREETLDYSPGEFGLKRLQKEIKQSHLTTSSRKPSTGKVWKLTAAAACLVVVLQTGYMLNSESDNTLTPAGSTTTLSAVPTHSVSFVGDAQEQDIRALLLSLNATIVDGPSALGIYKLHVRGDAQKALVRLQAQSSLIDFAQLDRQVP